MMKVRQATVDDIEHVAILGHRFIEAAQMPPATMAECRVFCEALLVHESAGVFMSPNGVIAGILAPLYYKPAHIQAVELFWWAEDGNGRLLLAAFEAWAKERGADDVNMSTLAHYTPPHVEGMLERRGYVARDRVYRKGLK
jgi:GNAT superfamily N-acetyltransferase